MLRKGCLKRAQTKALIVDIARTLNGCKFPKRWKLLYRVFFRGDIREIHTFIENFEIELLYRVMQEAQVPDITSENIGIVRRTLLDYIYEEALKQCAALEQNSLSLPLFSESK